MELMNNILAIITVFIGGILFFYIFRGMFAELIKDGVLKNKDGIFLSVTIFLVFVVYFFLESFHH